MRPCCGCEAMRRFIASIGSPSDNRDKSRGSPIAINRDHYYSSDGPFITYDGFMG